MIVLCGKALFFIKENISLIIYTYKKLALMYLLIRKEFRNLIEKVGISNFHSYF